MAGTHGDAVDQQPSAEFGHGTAQVVRPGPAGAARGDDDVGGQRFSAGPHGGPRRLSRPGCPFRLGVLQRGEPFSVAVADFRFAGTDPAEHFHDAGELGTEGVAHLPRPGDPGGDHLGAGEHQPDHGFAQDGQGVVAGEGREGQVGGVEHGAALDQQFAGGGFLRGFPDVLAVPRLAGLRAAAQPQDRQPVLIGGNRRRFRSAARPSLREESARP